MTCNTRGRKQQTSVKSEPFCDILRRRNDAISAEVREGMVRVREGKLSAAAIEKEWREKGFSRPYKELNKTLMAIWPISLAIGYIACRKLVDAAYVTARFTFWGTFMEDEPIPQQWNCSLADARAEIRTALLFGRLSAYGLRRGVNETEQIPAGAWLGLVVCLPGESPNTASQEGLENLVKPVWRDIAVERAAVLSLWPEIDVECEAETVIVPDPVEAPTELREPKLEPKDPSVAPSKLPTIESKGKAADRLFREMTNQQLNTYTVEAARQHFKDQGFIMSKSTAYWSYRRAFEERGLTVPPRGNRAAKQSKKQ